MENDIDLKQFNNDDLIELLQIFEGLNDSLDEIEEGEKDE